MTGRLDEIEADALSAIDFIDGLPRDAMDEWEKDFRAAFAELRAYRALNGELVGLVLAHIQESDPERHDLIESQIGRYYIHWLRTRENL